MLVSVWVSVVAVSDGVFWVSVVFRLSFLSKVLRVSRSILRICCLIVSLVMVNGLLILVDRKRVRYIKISPVIIIKLIVIAG